MKIKSLEFLKSSQKISECPPSNKPEFAFIGRSNVGKSSLINMLMNKKSLAKVSSVPGKTQLINHFEVNKTWYLVDLPGYGWAKVGQKMRESWENNINDYLLQRENLYCVFLLIDSRHEPLKNDLGFMQWMAEVEIPFMLIFTKTDKLSKNKVQSTIAKYRKIMKKTWEVMPQYLVSSSLSGEGKEEILNMIDNIIEDVN